MWRSYANQASGVCFGVDSSVLGITRAVPMRNILSVKDLQLGCAEVIYEPDRVSDIIENLFSLFGEQVRTAESLPIEVQMLFAQASLRIKNPAFASEQEVRLIHSPLLMSEGVGMDGDIDGKKTNTTSALGDLKFSPYSDQIGGYFELDLFRDNKDALVSVNIGPRSVQVPFHLEVFLKQHGYQKFKTLRSSAPLR
nr:DUF2971 domain-containing protein [Pseudovibrio flavus]